MHEIKTQTQVVIDKADPQANKLPIDADCEVCNTLMQDMSNKEKHSLIVCRNINKQIYSIPISTNMQLEVYLNHASKICWCLLIEMLIQNV